MSSWLITRNWNKYLHYFGEKNKDIYFTEKYGKLYENGKNIAECFIFQDEGKLFLLPYLKSKVKLIKAEYYDFETPYGYGGPIVNTNDKNFITESFNLFYKVARENKIIAGFIRFHPLLNNRRFVNEKCKIIFDRETIALNLALTKKRIWEEQIQPRHRNAIRKAEKSGLIFVVDEELDHLDDFIRLYTKTMNFLNAYEYYYFKKDYYRIMKKTLKGNCFLGLIYLKKEIISAAIFFRYGIYGHYHLSGWLREYSSNCPNNFLLYKVALYLKKGGIKVFHLGGGTDNRKDNPLYRFKKGFSKGKYDFYIGKVVFNSEIYNEVCRLWEVKFPDKKEKNRKLLLKYRY